MVTTPEMPEASLQLLRADSPALANLSRTLVSVAEAQRQMLANLDMSGLSRTLVSVAEAQRQMLANLDMSGLPQLMSTVEGFRILSQAQLTTAASAVEEAYRATPEDDVPEELLTELEDSVRSFTASEAVEYLPVEVSRQHFSLFIGAVVMTSLMTVTFSSETADGILGKILELSGLVALVMVAAGKAHDRVTGTTTEANSGSVGDSPEDT
ncbi:hypothetical protein QZN11_36930 [Streptomyces gramineus]|uniref:hypothetical protein n=1 Tax=Streptomyces gramineus TaxID=910542 RepID=UPI00398A5BC2